MGPKYGPVKVKNDAGYGHGEFKIAPLGGWAGLRRTGQGWAGGLRLSEDLGSDICEAVLECFVPGWHWPRCVLVPSLDRHSIANAFETCTDVLWYFA